MDKMLGLVLGLVCAFVVADGASLPSGLPVCKVSDTACLTNALNKGLPFLAGGSSALGLPKLDPLFVKNIHIQGNGGNVDLDQTYNDMHVSGLTKLEAKSVTPNFKGDNCNLKLSVVVPYADLVAPYKFTGKLLLFSINGHGASNVTLLNTAATFEYKCEKYTKDGKVYAKITDLELDLAPEKLVFDIENLIDGNKQLSDEVLKVMNENDLEIYKELKKDYQATFGEIFKQLAFIVFNKVPIDELFLPD